MSSWSGLCVGGDSHYVGHVVTCSVPHWQHLARDGRLYLKYVWNRDLVVWAPEGWTYPKILEALKNAYKLAEQGTIPELRIAHQKDIDARVMSRIDLGIDQKRIARDMGVHPSYINRLVKRYRNAK